MQTRRSSRWPTTASWATCSRSCQLSPRSSKRNRPNQDSMTRETLEVDVLIVGGGPAGLSAALRLSQLQKQQGGEPLSIAVLEKAREAGAHILSGAVLDPSTLRELIPDFDAQGAPIAAPVVHDRVYFLTRKRALRFPLVPRPLVNHGNLLVSLSRLVKWMAERV